MTRLVALAVATMFVGACGPSTTPPPTSTAVPTPVVKTTEPSTTTTAATQPPAPLPWKTSGIDWSRPPQPGPAPSFSVPTPTSFRLANQLRVVVIPRHKLPVISMRLINPFAGSKYERAKQSGLATLTADLLDEGAGKYDTMGVSKQLERLGASMWLSAGEDDVTIGLNTLSTTLTKSLQLLTAIVSKPRLTSADFKRVQGDRLSSIRRRRDSPRRVVGLIHAKILWGNHPYGRPISGTTQTLSSLRLGDVRRFYRRHYAPRLMTLVIAGDVNPKALKAELNRTLGRWRKRMATPRTGTLPAPVKTPPRLVVSNKANAAQSVVRIGRISVSRVGSHHFPATVINAALGGSFASRLNQRLREQLGYTYGARAAFWYGDKTGTWTVRTSLKTANTIDGIKEAFKLIDSVRSSDLPASELARTKSLLARGLPQRFERNSGLVSVFAELLQHSLPLSWYEHFVPGITSVTAAQARAFATKHWNKSDLVLVVIGDLKKILPGLLKLGLGPALELDAEGKVIKTHPAADTK